MDATTKVILEATGGLPKNQTDVTELRDDVEYLSIIVWSMGGVILLSLLFLLGRIILAPRKQLQEMDYIPDDCRAAPSLYQIGMERHDWPTTQSSPPRRDTAGLMHQSDSTHRDTHPPQYTARADGHNSNRSQSEMTQQHFQNSENMTSGESHQSDRRPETVAHILPTDPTGTRAAVNGYIIRPPSYRDVIGIGRQLPSVVVTRAQPRYQLFSL